MSTAVLLPFLYAAALAVAPLGERPQSWLCDDYNNGSVIQGLISLYNETSRTREFRLICVNLLDAGLLHFPGLEWQGRTWQWVRRRLDVPEPPALGAEPGDWAEVGCKGNEILVGINSVDGADGVQSWRPATEPGQNFLVMTPPGEAFGPYVFNAVRSRYSKMTGDRTFEMKSCAAYTVPEWPREKSRDCKFSLISSEADDLARIQGRVFTSYRTSDVQECAKICANHWFCYTFVWSPNLEKPDRPNCRLSYRPLARAEVCEASSVWHSGLSHLGSLMDDPDIALVFPCFQCLSTADAEDLFHEKSRLRRLLI